MKCSNGTIQAPACLPADVFNGLSRDELLAVLGVMHRILEANRKRDLDHLVSELPALFGGRTAASTIGSTRGPELLSDSPEPNSGRTYPLLHYVFDCLSKAQTRMETPRSGPVPIDKARGHLSPREMTVLLWMKEGKTNWEIARILGLSERTVRFHVGGIFEKLDVTSRTQAVARALGSGLIAS
jgi:DNA-binding CsgD family transcriptional regulator